MSKVQRQCENEHCKKQFIARQADVNRGWARFCSKTCKAKEQEQEGRTHQYSELLNSTPVRSKLSDEEDPGDDLYWMNKQTSLSDH